MNLNNNNNNNASISIAQNKLSSVALTAVETNMSLVSRQKSAEKQTQSEDSLVNCSTQEDQRVIVVRGHRRQRYRRPVLPVW